MRTVVRYLAHHHIALLALLALFWAMSGSAYALTLPKNSVGANQRRRNAVTSVKVKNHSLQAADFATGQLSTGPPQGPGGPAGVAGPAGERGPTGPKGDRGPSDVYASAFDDFAVPAAAVPAFELAEQDLPAGSFVVTANANAENRDTEGNRGVVCAIGDPGIDASGRDDNVDIATQTLQAGEAKTAPLLGVIQTAHPETVTFDCYQSGNTAGNGLRFTDIDIGAVQVGALH